MPVFFAGSFNPFTAGHASIVDRALAQFDGVVIAIGANYAKPDSMAGAEQRRRDIEALYAADPRVSVVVYPDLTAMAAARFGCSAIVRGVRSVHDFEYERDMADINRRINGMETVMLMALPELACVSSSVVRELDSYGLDTSQFMPKPQ